MANVDERVDPESPPVDREPEPESEPGDESVIQAIAAVSGHIEEIRGQIDRLLRIRVDRARLKFRESAQTIVLGSLLLVAALALTVAGVLYTVAGVTAALTVAFAGRAWAGNMAGGLLVLLLVWVATVMVARGRRRRELQDLVAKYESADAPTEGRPEKP